MLTDQEMTEMAHRVPRMPIETAPRDGRRILGHDRRLGWREMWWKSDAYEGEYWTDDADSEPAPSHWMPVPGTTYGRL